MSPSNEDQSSTASEQYYQEHPESPAPKCAPAIRVGTFPQICFKPFFRILLSQLISLLP